eukprot:4931804-Heterocapsa_arctica.AAC.1
MGGGRLATAADHIDLQDFVELLEAETPVEDLFNGRGESADRRQRPPSSRACDAEERDPYGGCSAPSPSLTFSRPLRRLRGRRESARRP